MRFYALIYLSAVIAVSLSAFVRSTDRLQASLVVCSTNVRNDVHCIDNVKKALEKTSEYIDKVGELKDKMKDLQTGLRTVSTILDVAKYIAELEFAVYPLKLIIRTVNSTLTGSLDAIDRKVYLWKKRVVQGVDATTRASEFLFLMSQRCSTGENAVLTARACVKALDEVGIKWILRDKLEQAAGTLSPVFDKVNRVYRKIGKSCEAAERFAENMNGWPTISQLDDILNELNKVHDPLKDILKFLKVVDDVLNKEVCPEELVREVKDKAYAAEKYLSDTAKSIVNTVENASLAYFSKIKRFFGKRSVDNIEHLRMKRSEGCLSVREVLGGATAVYSVGKRILGKRSLDSAGHLRMKRSNVFLSIWDEVDNATGFMLKKATSLLSQAIQNIPGLTLPGLPNTDILANMDLNINLPSIDFQFDSRLVSKLAGVRWDCSTQVANACRRRSLNVIYDCSLTI